MDQEIILLVGVFIAGALTGIIMMLIFNKLSTGSATAGQVNREMEDYQGQVESHFEETSKKFKEMTDQYQDLYQHLSVGATSLCRPENIAPGLVDQSAPNTKALPKDASNSKSDKPKNEKPKNDEKVVKEVAEKASKSSAAAKTTKTEAKAPKSDAKASEADKAVKSKGNYDKNKNKK